MLDNVFRFIDQIETVLRNRQRLRGDHFDKSVVARMWKSHLLFKCEAVCPQDCKEHPVAQCVVM
ncbi:hypothetical protein BS297_23350 [Rhodococcus erythropolis]|uniref:Uncharacterized protein n=1 Tax=Rhodococcus erythropolis TaxID=1833 RepID=A0A5N5DXP3_RHOER|nr:hypothetical protein BS297_23350 [Rhodococcus erythropolis]